MKKVINSILKKIPPTKKLLEQKEELKILKRFFPPGHFYSPIPSVDEIKKNENKIFKDIPRTLPGINLNEKEQIKLLNIFKQYYKTLPFPTDKTNDLRYFYKNPAYGYSDAIFLHSIIRHVKPKKIIEVGCGYSSCVILDTNELLFNNSIQCTFIEPFPELLLSLIKEDDKKSINIIPKKLQDVGLNELTSLQENDILFIDSTHVSKINSDVNYIFFKILPSLDKGVYIHFHDIFYPFQYPKEWIYEGRAWNEDYILRAFLQFNSSFKIIMFNTFLEYFYEDFFKKEMPLCMNDKGGSIWIKKC